MLFSSKTNNSIVITMGDPDGIGPEIILKALFHIKKSPLDFPIIIFGNWSAFESIQLQIKTDLNIKIISNTSLNIDDSGDHIFFYETGSSGFSALNKAVHFMKQNRIARLVTAPMSKKSFLAKFPGHTEFLQHFFSSSQAVMTFIGKSLRVMTLTTHCPLSSVVTQLRNTNIELSIRIFCEFLREILQTDPKIAVCGINPHAGENGLIGNEEQEILLPIIQKLQKEFPLLSLPMPADTVFYQAFSKQVDGVIAMYHDQALAPFKMIHFHDGIHVTLGLPIIRTSPDHGTAFDIAGKNLANPQSMIEAIKFAAGFIF